MLRFSVLSTSLVVVSSSLSPCLVAPWDFLLFAWAPRGFVQCSLLSLYRVASTFLFPFCNPSSYGLHPTILLSAFPGYCLFHSSALLFLSFCMGAWSTYLVFLPCVSLLGFHSSLFPSGHLMSFFGRSSDSVGSSLHYATGSPFVPSQLLVSLLEFRYGSHSSWVSSPFAGPSPRSPSVLHWGFLSVCFPVGFLTFHLLLFLRLLSVPSMCPLLAPILALAWVSHYFSVFPSWCLGRISVPSRWGSPSGPSLFCRGFHTFFPMVPFLSTSLSVFLICFVPPSISRCVHYCLLRRFFLAVSFLILVAGWLSRLCLCVSVPLAEALSLILGFSQLILFPLFFLVFSSLPVTIHLSAF